MSQQPEPAADDARQGDQSGQGPDVQPSHVVIVGPDGRPVAAVPASALRQPGGDSDEESEADLSSLVEQPAKVMRIGSMIRQLLEEVKSAPLDEARAGSGSRRSTAVRSRSSRPGSRPNSSRSSSA